MKRLVGLFAFLVVFGWLGVSRVYASAPAKNPYCNDYSDVGDKYCDTNTSVTDRTYTCRRYYTSTGYYYYWSTSYCSSGQFCSGGSCVTCVPGQKRCVQKEGCGDGGAVDVCSSSGLWDGPGSMCCAYSLGYTCVNGSCVQQTTCEQKGGQCMFSTECISDYGGSPVYSWDCFNFWGGSGLSECCIIDWNSIFCNSDNQCGDCQECVEPGTIRSYCKSTRTTGARGVVGSANNSSLCSISSSTPGLCTTTYGTTITDSIGSDGTFNWSCAGQSASTCRSAGVGVSGVATKLPIINGDCGTVNGSCNTGIATGVGTTQIVSGGINNVWNCAPGNSCGGSTDNCSAVRCTNAAVVNGACNSNILGTSASDLCYRGTPVYDSRDANHDYINDSNESEYVWGCEGSTNTCAEGDGDDQLNCSSTLDQGNWFQVSDGSVLAKGSVTNYVPITTRNGGTLNLISTVNNGRVYSKLTSSVSGYDAVQKVESNTFSFGTYPYTSLRNDYFGTKGVGITLVDNVSWDTVRNLTGVIFVNGDLNITGSGKDLVTTNFVMIIAKGTITIDPSINEVDAILVANKVIASGDASAQLVINGMIHSITDIEFSRNLVPESLNNTTPSVKVNYQPELLFGIPTEITKAFSRWRVN